MDGLFLSKNGDWFHDGDPVRHPHLAALLHRSIARQDGSLVVTTGRDVLPIIVEDAPFVVRTIEGDALVLSDGTREPIAQRIFFIDDDNRLRCVVKAGAFYALLSRTATQLALEHFDGSRLLLPGGPCTLTSTAKRDWGSVPP